MTLIRTLTGLVLALGGAGAMAMGIAWAYVAIAGSEWDYCNGSECTPGYYAASIPISAGVALLLAGVVLLRKPPD